MPLRLPYPGSGHWPFHVLSKRVAGYLDWHVAPLPFKLQFKPSWLTQFGKGLQMRFRSSLPAIPLLVVQAAHGQVQNPTTQTAPGYLAAASPEMALALKLLIAASLVCAGIVFIIKYLNHRNAVAFTLEQLKHKISKIREHDKTKNIYVGIDGDACTGKTTLTSSFTENPNLIVIHADFYREENCHFFYNWEKIKNDLEKMIAGRQGLVIVIEGWRLFLNICPQDSKKKHPYLAKIHFDLKYKQPYVLNIDFDLHANVQANYKTKLDNLRIRHPDGDEEDIERIALRQLRDYAGVKYDLRFKNSAKYRIPLHHKFNIMPS